MNDLLTMLKMLHRPRLLIRAARFGLSDYNREKHLRRVLSDAAMPTPGRAIAALMSAESVLEEKRKTGDASYSIAEHIELLIAMMGEARLLESKTM